MNTNENKHMIFARIQQALAKRGVYTTLSLHVNSLSLSSFSAFSYIDGGLFKTVLCTNYTEEQLLGIWSSIDSDGIEALARLEVLS